MATTDKPAEPAVDPLSAALQHLTAEASAVFRMFRAPWGLGIERVIGPTFHIVTNGQCHGETEEQDPQLLLRSGDLVMFPTRQRRWLRDAPATPPSALKEILACVSPDTPGQSCLGGAGARTPVVCGALALEAGDSRPVSLLLPSVIHIPGTAGQPVPWVAATLAVMADENDSFAPGSHGVINRLAELSVSQALRIAFAERAGRDSAFRSFRDPQIARSTARIHASSGWPSTVGVLASEVALSRSALATRYRQVVGESPMSYLTRTRLAFAASTLRSTDRSLQEIARQVGYATQFSFSNAFKRTFGLSPREYRGQSGGMSSHPTFVEAARTPATNEGANGAA